MDDEGHGHLSYLLRIWVVEQNGALVWRASLESSRRGERLGFADLDALFAFLRQQTSTTGLCQVDGETLRPFDDDT